MRALVLVSAMPPCLSRFVEVEKLGSRTPADCKIGTMVSWSISASSYSVTRDRFVGSMGKSVDRSTLATSVEVMEVELTLGGLEELGVEEQTGADEGVIWLIEWGFGTSASCCT